MWVDLCSNLPCDALMHWPLYDTCVLDNVKIPDQHGVMQDAVIQCWKGFCPDALSGIDGYYFPGGVGAEVGVYMRQPGRDPHANLVPAVPPNSSNKLKVAAELWLRTRSLRMDIDNINDFWWPADQLVADSGHEVKFTLAEHLLGETLITSTPTNRYWNCEWMRPHSFTKWTLGWHARHQNEPAIDLLELADVWKYILNFSVAGVNYVWDESGIRTVPLISQAMAPSVS
jgi:hypothetical protein